MRGAADPDLAHMGVHDLLRLYSDVLDELIRRGVLRSRNAPAGDLAEAIVAHAYRGALAPPSEKGWDVRTTDDVLLQVKCRVILPGSRRTHVFSPFRSWGFDACVFVVLNSETYAVDHAVEVPVDKVKAAARESAWVAAHRITVGQIRSGIDGSVDVTEQLKAAYETMDRP